MAIPLECNECGRIFSTDQELLKHKAEAHKSTQSTTNPNQPLSGPVPPAPPNP